jgi:hypothetical protein
MYIIIPPDFVMLESRKCEYLENGLYTVYVQISVTVDPDFVGIRTFFDDDIISNAASATARL